MKQLFIIGIMCFLVSACGQSAGSEQKSTGSMETQEAKVHVYYFHGKMRCVTCITLQKVTEEAVAENFAGNKDVAFVEVDFSEKANEALAEKYEIVFSSIVIATETDYKDITDDAFALVMGSPEELKAMIVKEVNALLNK